MAGLEEITRIAIAFRRRVAVMEVRCNRVQSKSAIDTRQVVEVAHEYRLAVSCYVGRTGNDSVKAPEILNAQVAMYPDCCRRLVNLVKFYWWKCVERLMRNHSSLPSFRVR